MWEGSYASEPFDLRLTVLRLLRSLGWMILFTLIGTVVFGGGYYVKNVLLGEPPRYEKTITCKMEYTEPPVQSGDYYINEMTWNTYVDSGEFLAMVGQDARAEELSAKVASDIHVPSFTVSAETPDRAEVLSSAVQAVLVGAFADSVPEIAAIKVIDVSDTVPVKPDVRPLRAFVLSAVLSGFFVVLFFLLREIGADSVWLPATLRRRYGLPALGTINSLEFEENAEYLLGERKTIAICTTDEETDPKAVQDALTKCEKESLKGREWLVVPTPVLSPEAMQVMRQAEGVLLVVPAGLHGGKPLEYLLEFLKTQEISVTAALLWEADEALIRSYYFLGNDR